MSRIVKNYVINAATSVLNTKVDRKKKEEDYQIARTKRDLANKEFKESQIALIEQMKDNDELFIEIDKIPYKIKIEGERHVSVKAIDILSKK